MSELRSHDRVVKVISNQYGSPTSITYLALQIVKLAQTNLNQIIHVTNLGNISWFEFAKEVATINKISSERIQPISLESYKRPARRPINTSLVSEVNDKNKVFPTLSWEKALFQYFT